MKNLKEFIPLWNLIKKEKFKLIIASLLVFFTQFCRIFEGYFVGATVEGITKMNLKIALIFLALYFVLQVFIIGIIQPIAYAMLRKVEAKLTCNMAYMTYEKTANLPAYAFEKTKSGEIINRITNDTQTLANTFNQLLRVFSSLIGAIIILFYIFYNSWLIGVEILFFLLIIFLIIKKYNPLLKKINKEKRKYNDDVTSQITESVRGIREIKTLGIKKNILYEVFNTISKLFTKVKKEIEIGTKFNLLTYNIKSFLEIGVFLTCILLVYYGKVSITFFVAMTYYIYRYMYLIEDITNITQTYQTTVVALSRVNELLTNKLYKDELFGNVELNNTKGVIEFKNVSFAYPNESLILKDFNLKLEPNKKIAIVGKSGQGKSTIFNLLTRVFDVKSGEITLDGVNIQDLTEDSLRKNIAIIRQEPFIFNRTIKENFKILNDKIKLNNIREYTKKAYLDDYIMSLPKKYNTLIGEGGVNLSGGQKQRLAIARVLAKESKVVLFDEATSALDNNSQEFIKESIDNLIEDHTVIIIAHRLSTIIDADIIYVIDGGKVVAKGKHNTLIKKSKIYKNLYNTEIQ